MPTNEAHLTCSSSIPLIDRRILILHCSCLSPVALRQRRLPAYAKYLLHVDDAVPTSLAAITTERGGAKTMPKFLAGSAATPSCTTTLSNLLRYCEPGAALLYAVFAIAKHPHWFHPDCCPTKPFLHHTKFIVTTRLFDSFGLFPLNLHGRTLERYRCSRFAS